MGSEEKACAPRVSALVGLLTFMLALLAAPVEAQREVLRRPALHWVRDATAESCVDPRTLAHQVEELVGPVLVRPSEAEHSLEGFAEARASGVRVRLRVLNQAGRQIGERVLDHAGACHDIAPAIAFVVAMMIDPGVAAHGLPPALVALLAAEAPDQALLQELEGGAEAAPPSDPAVAVELPEPPPRPPAAADGVREEPIAPERARDPIGVQAALLARVSWRDTAGLLLSGEERMSFDVRGPFSVAVHVRGGAQFGDHTFEPQRTIRMIMLAAGGALCAGHGVDARVRLFGCAGGEFSTTLARGSGLPVQRSTYRADVGITAQLGGRVRLHRGIGVMLLVTGRASLAPRRFVYEDMSGATRTAYTMSRVSVGVALGPTIEF
jgi:hypothetical protein